MGELSRHLDATKRQIAVDRTEIIYNLRKVELDQGTMFRFETLLENMMDVVSELNCLAIDCLNAEEK